MVYEYLGPFKIDEKKEISQSSSRADAEGQEGKGGGRMDRVQRALAGGDGKEEGDNQDMLWMKLRKIW